MNSRCTFCLLACLVCLSHYELTSQRHEKQPKSYSSAGYAEVCSLERSKQCHMTNFLKQLTVRGEDLKQCEGQKNICVLDTNDCGSVPAHGTEQIMLLNVSCRFLVYEKTFGCKWTYINDFKSKIIHSFVFSRTTDFSHCPSIFNLLSEFNLIIKMKDIINNIERRSEVYSIVIVDIVQFPSPNISSVNATQTSVNVTWSKEWNSEKCLVRHKLSAMDEWTEEEDSENFHVIEGLQPFSQYSITVACIGHFGLQSDWSAEFRVMTSEGDELTSQRHEKQPKSYSSAELTVSGEDVKQCEGQKNICVLDTNDCGSVPAHGAEQIMLLNVSCRFRYYEKTFGCKWTYINDVKSKIIHSFVFSRTTDFSHCPSIFNLLSEFNLIIKMKDIINNIERRSEVYSIVIEDIAQFPSPKISSVNATQTSVNVTWSKEWNSTICLVRHKLSTMDEGTEEEDSENFHVIEGLQPFSQYSITVACIGPFGLQSDWSAEFRVMTSEGVPTAPHVSYCVEPLNYTFRTQKLVLIWKALEIYEARGVILGYVVTYTSTKQPMLNRINITSEDLKAEFEVVPGNYNITLMACNSAGLFSVSHFNINTPFYKSLPGVKGLWASTEADSLRIRWEIEKAAVNVSEFAIEWVSSRSASKQWKRVNGSTFSTTLTGINQLETYNISVYSLYEKFCGPSESIQASLESGAHLDIDDLKCVNVTKTSVMVQWVWQRKVPSENVLQYRLILKGPNETKSLIVFPNQRQHSFSKLQTNVYYSVYIYGETKLGNFSKAHTKFSTPLFENDEIVKAVVPIVLMIVGFGIFSVLSRTIYKDYFYPSIANPGQSLIGRWLLNPLHERDTVMRVIKLEDFSLTNQLTEKAFIQMEHQKFSKKVADEDMIYCPDNCTVENSDGMDDSQASSSLTEYVDLPLLPDNSGYVENYHIPGRTNNDHL